MRQGVRIRVVRTIGRACISLSIGIVVLVLLVTGCCNRQGEITLARDGRSKYRIVIARDASESTFYAALELQKFLYRMSGAVLPILSDAGPAGSHEILLGPSGRLDGLNDAPDLSTLGDEGYVITTSGNYLIIAGGNRRGDLYGVYGLLEDHLGCRWFRPDVSRIPHMDSIVLSGIDDRAVPRISYREPYIWEAFDGDWAARNRMNRNSRDGGLTTRHGGRIEWVPDKFAHTFAKFMPLKEYYRRHPDYFSLVNGRRVSNRPQLCCTNEDVIEIITECVLEEFRTYPWADVISVSQNDWDNHCECPRCRALAEQEESDMAPVLYLVNRVAEAVEREYPGKIVETLAYQWSRKPPKTMRPRGNVAIRLCTIECCFAHPLATCTSEENRAFAEDLRAWGRVADRLWIWNYATSFAHYFVPYPNLRVRDDNIRFFADNNVTAVFEQGVYTTPHGEFSGLSAYVTAKLLWNPDYDEETAIDEYLEGVYGAASGPIRAYLDLIHDRVEREDIHMNIWQGPEAEYLAADVLASADSLFVAAEQAVASDPLQLDRVKTVRLSVDYAILCQGKTRGTAWLVDHDTLRLDVDPAYTARLGRFCSQAENAGVVRLKEYNYTVDEFRADIDKAVKPKTLKRIKSAGKPGTRPGLGWRFYRGAWKRLLAFNRLNPSSAGTIETAGFPDVPTLGEDEETYGFLLDGFIEIPHDGVYEFFTVSDGYAGVKIGGRKIIHNGGNDPVRERCGFAALSKGYYPVEIVFFTREGGTRLEFYIEGPDMPKHEVTPDMLTH